MINPEWIGFAAAFCTTSAYLPQAVKTLRTRDTRSLSLCMYVLVVCGGILWASYGIMIGSPSVMAANLISLSMTTLILLMKIRYG